ncbi:MAG: hypothetical protein WC455_11720 [Dehalococcoidia bacterium]|jgi:hypothetical protein
MACAKRERTGSCGHYQCPFPAVSGYECVDIFCGYCEVGEGCVDKCEWSCEAVDSDKALEAVYEAFPELRDVIPEVTK